MICEKCGKKLSVSKGKCDSCGAEFMPAAAGSFELKPKPVYFEQENINHMAIQTPSAPPKTGKIKIVLTVLLAVCVSGVLGWFARGFFVKPVIIEPEVVIQDDDIVHVVDKNGWDMNDVICYDEDDGYYLVARCADEDLKLGIWKMSDKEDGSCDLVKEWGGENFNISLFSSHSVEPIAESDSQLDNSSDTDSSTTSTAAGEQQSIMNDYDEIIKKMKENSQYLGEGTFAVSPYGPYTKNGIWYVSAQNHDSDSNFKFKNCILTDSEVLQTDSECLSDFVNGEMIARDSVTDDTFSIYFEDGSVKKLVPDNGEKESFENPNPETENLF